MSSAQNQALYALIGTLYGPYSSTQFSLPDLRGRVVVGQGTASFGSFTIAQTGGSPTTTITTSNMPAHTHAAVLTLEDATTTINVNSSDGTSAQPGGKNTSFGKLTADKAKLYNGVAPTIAMNIAGNTVSGSVTIGSAGGSQTHYNMQPFLAMNYVISLSGLFPPRN